MTELVTLEDVRAAAAALTGVVRRTPLEPSRDPSLDGVHLKCENLQRAGSFKIRGAYMRVSRLTDAERAQGVVAASAGNHAQGVALAATTLGIHSTVFMPAAAPLPKVAATKGYGADVILGGATVDDALEAAHRFAAETGATLIHPFDHRDIVAGQGTIALEILDQLPETATIVTAVGGGGLIAGIAAAAKELRPDIRIVGVQAAGAAAYPDSLAAGKPVRLEKMNTIADGIAVGRPGDVPFEIVDHLVDEIVTVTEEDISRALLSLLERNKLVVEPAGATAYAALLNYSVPYTGPTVAVISGGNIDPLLLMRLIGHGLAASGRFLRCNLRCPDRPGALASVLQLVGAYGGNIVDVFHQRSDPRLSIGEVSVDLSIETRGSEHATEIVAALRDAGYFLTVAGSSI
ncbi:threonine ammonia-lyase [Glycomyces buryatensis]|uniref:threonine ammonia-lyase n=1 Tax=Glycomyces buryatensis TaxID=2570927 RepID=A0A4S8QGA3_9ACTN|nr:threonine ammonia-lyase [Glycomyces buryatensis]THV41975.1 threonine ammonia-lyase [Glycomyces buryatensis]